MADYEFPEELLYTKEDEWIRRDGDEAVVGARDEYGQRYDLDVEITGPDGSGTVRSTWIVRADESPPRLITCHVL